MVVPSEVGTIFGGRGGVRTYVAWLHLRQRQASFKSPGNLDACGFADGCCARHALEEAVYFSTRFTFCQTNVHDQCCASR